MESNRCHFRNWYKEFLIWILNIRERLTMKMGWRSVNKIKVEEIKPKKYYEGFEDREDEVETKRYKIIKIIKPKPPE